MRKRERKAGDDMGGISTAIELQDNFTGIMMNIINSINMSVAAVEQMQSVMGGTIDTSSIEQANEAVQALNNTLQNMETPSVISPAIDCGNVQPAGTPVIETPDDIQVQVEAVVTEQPQVDVPDSLIVPVEPVVTEQPTVEAPNDVIVDISANGISEMEQQIAEITNRLNSVAGMQDAIKTAGNNLYVLPDDAVRDIIGVNREIEQMRQALEFLQSNPFHLDTSITEMQINAISDSLNEVIAKQQHLDELMDHVPSQMIDVDVNPVVPELLVENTEVTVPIQWQSDNLEVFTNTGIERFEQEVQSTNSMLQQLSSTQDAIAKQAYNTNIFPPEAFQNLNTMAVRIDNIRDRIQQIESNPLNMGTDAANAELEQLRAQLNQAVQVQELMNQAVQDMDVQAANEAYLRLSQIIGNTERHIRDNVDEQGRFNNEIREGMDSAADLKNMIAGAVGAFAGMALLKNAKSWIDDCTTAFNTQLNSETQLISVLANMLDEEYVAQFEVETAADTTAAIDEISAIQSEVDEVVVPVTAETRALTAAYDRITAKASEIQGRGIYGDEIMIAGAAEFATYFSDTDAIEMMMDTLTNYAMGMSGGGAIDASGMVGYATDLGKIMSGSYGAMTKKGFEFTDAQKAIVEGEATREQIVSALGEEYLDMSADMQAAAAISQVIDEAWGGLYETMSNTPEGKIIQMTNTWGDMMEVVGGQLYPYVLLFVDAITENWDTIQTVLDGITFGLQMMLGVMSWLLEGVIGFAQNVIDNWGQIAPVVSTIAGALLVLCAAFFVYNAVMGVAAAVQALFNTTLLGCPLAWILVVIIAVIAAVYKIVEAVNNATGSTYSALGIIMGALAAADAFIWNLVLGAVDLVLGLFEYLINPFINFANFIGNLFNDPIGSVIHLFGDMTDTVLGMLQKVASTMDFVLGTSMADTVQGWRDSLSVRINEEAEQYGNGQYEEIVSRLDLSVEGMGLSRIGYGEAWDAGYSFGEGIDESIANFDPSSLFGTTDIPSADDYAAALTAGGIGSGIDDIAGNTGAMADAMDITEEELKYLRDIAEQETINRFTTAEIHLEQTNHNTIKNSMDLDGIMSGMTDMMNEAIDISTEGVHE